METLTGSSQPTAADGNLQSPGPAKPTGADYGGTCPRQFPGLATLRVRSPPLRATVRLRTSQRGALGGAHDRRAKAVAPASKTAVCADPAPFGGLRARDQPTHPVVIYAAGQFTTTLTRCDLPPERQFTDKEQHQRTDLIRVGFREPADQRHVAEWWRGSHLQVRSVRAQD